MKKVDSIQVREVISVKKMKIIGKYQRKYYDSKQIDIDEGCLWLADA